jgi:hypothetical protein
LAPKRWRLAPTRRRLNPTRRRRLRRFHTCHAPRPNNDCQLTVWL